MHAQLSITGNSASGNVGRFRVCHKSWCKPTSVLRLCFHRNWSSWNCAASLLQTGQDKEQSSLRSWSLISHHSSHSVTEVLRSRYSSSNDGSTSSSFLLTQEFHFWKLTHRCTKWYVCTVTNYNKVHNSKNTRNSLISSSKKIFNL